MTPVASWTPADYHRAFNRCRAAWERTSPQLTIDGWADMVDGLDEPRAGAARLVEPATPQASPRWRARYQTTTAPAAEPRTGLRGRGQEGL